ncbi:MAG: DnaJ domain-containing protein [Deltaproteobacteria bacterium]|jgi:DnaJ-class molecular chaperone|nr:DnaJ domain-containing protein [Deltaproteobacteria bacterium]
MNGMAYSELNLKKGASESEIKAAFRKLAKEHHPDSGRPGYDVEKFRNAYRAYRELLGQAKKAGHEAAQKPAPVSPTAFVFDGQRTHGLDVYYDLAVERPQSLDGGFGIVLPFTAREACPRCLGKGQTLGRLSPGGDVYRPRTCPRCHGAGSLGRASHLTVRVTAGMAGRGKFRLRGAGGYLPSQARRGDLIVSLRFVDSLPAGN